MKITKEMKEALDRVFESMKADYARFMPLDDEIQTEMREEYNSSISYDVGRKYIKIVKGGSVHSFIVNTEYDKKFAYGDVLMAACWAAPARNFPRGNIFDSENISRVFSWVGVS